MLLPQIVPKTLFEQRLELCARKPAVLGTMMLDFDGSHEGSEASPCGPAPVVQQTAQQPRAVGNAPTLRILELTCWPNKDKWIRWEKVTSSPAYYRPAFLLHIARFDPSARVPAAQIRRFFWFRSSEERISSHETAHHSFYFRQELGVCNELSHAVCVIFFKDVALTPLAQAVDVQFGTLWPNTPRNLPR